MSTGTTLERRENEGGLVSKRIAFTGDSGVGKTTIAALVATRLSERAHVQVTGEAAELVSGHNPDTHDALDIEWHVEDCSPGTKALTSRATGLDTVFIVTTPENLESTEKYERIATEHGIECFLVVNRFREAAKERLRTFDGPELAEYFYDNERISAAIDSNRVPTLPDWTCEAILIEALQPKREEAERALEALEHGERSIVNVEVEDRADADPLIDSFERAGYRGAYFKCNCQCHDGHVLARRTQ